MFKELNILKLFLEEPTREFNVREIARILKIAPATASSKLKTLEKKGLLKVRKERLLDLYKANSEEEFYKDLKIFYNIRKLKESGLIKELNRFYLKPTIIFFGSGSKGEDTLDSDLDLLVISEKTKDFLDKKIFEEKLNRKIQLFIVRDVNGLRNKHLVNNILNGITLQGGIKWT